MWNFLFCSVQDQGYFGDEFMRQIEPVAAYVQPFDF
jgi:hypothetical protein